jgi:hypothetical protein
MKEEKDLASPFFFDFFEYKQNLSEMGADHRLEVRASLLYPVTINCHDFYKFGDPKN